MIEIFNVSEVDFRSHRDTIERIRFTVFVNEQGIPAELEMDAHDETATHVLAWRADEAIASGRLLQDGHIGRVAVLRPWRGKGVGLLVMKELIRIARSKGLKTVALASQKQALGFYRKLGFSMAGDIYIEAGIEHVDMRLEL